jgi:hypothetical protein
MRHGLGLGAVKKKIIGNILFILDVDCQVVTVRYCGWEWWDWVNKKGEKSEKRKYHVKNFAVRLAVESHDSVYWSLKAGKNIFSRNINATGPFNNLKTRSQRCYSLSFL